MNNIPRDWSYDPNFLTESAADRGYNENTQYKTSVNSFAPVLAQSEKDRMYQSFNERFEDLAKQYKRNDMDIKRDIPRLARNDVFMKEYKEALLDPISSALHELSPNDPHVTNMLENVNRLWDNKTRMFTEAAGPIDFLPISSLEFPVLVKQFFASVLKDIIDVEAVKTPSIVKHIRTTYMVNNQTGEELEYPKCLFDGTWERMWLASKGHKIKEDVVPLTGGILNKYDIIAGVTDGVPGVDHLSLDIRISAIQVGSEIIELPHFGMTFEWSTGGTINNGKLNFTAPSGTVVDDVIGGQLDFDAGTISLASTTGQVTGVVFSGWLSNEDNLRTLSVRERRSRMTFNIPDGQRFNMPFTIEQIEDAAAMLDMNFYNRMVDEIVECEEQQECMTVIKFLNDQYDKFNGVKTDIWNLEPLANEYKVDLLPQLNGFAGDPFKYVPHAIQFAIRNIIHHILDSLKIEDLSFVIVGNPMATQLLSEFVQWKQVSGTAVGGIKVNNSYGFATDLGATVRVVASNIYDAYTIDEVDETGKRELVLHIYAYPVTDDRITFKHLKYTSHLMTSEGQTDYMSPSKALGGAYKIVTATSRFKTISIQGIQARLVFLNSEKVTNIPAPQRPPIMGAPWDGVDLTGIDPDSGDDTP